jgi:hypothetical protein
MKSRFWAGFAVMALALGSVVCVSAQTPTTEPGPGPSEQPNAPFEIGQEQANPQDKPSAGQPQPGQQHAGPPPQHAGPPPQGDQDEDSDADAPSGEGPAKSDQGVARISMMHGDVSTQRGDSGDWSAAILNQPVMGGDKVSTGDNARAELQLEYSNVLRLGANAKANIANLTHKNIQIQVGQGMANYTVYEDSEAEPEIDTPNVAVHPAHQDGVFRIEVRPDGDTIVIVRKGEAQISTPQGSAEVHQGEMATVRGNSDSAQYKVSEAPPRDDWDRWNSDRDHMIRNASSWKHTNHYYTGTEDLDANGRWDNVPDYGNVWVPNEPDGWAPYRDGNWTYEPYYGWTWVGYEPWGWAPYHYGRWFWYGNSWAWWPGPGGFYRPFWSPAYVSFFGWGGGFGFGVGFGWGSFGWLPIGPCDRFFPWWGGYGGRFGFVGARRFGTFNHGGFAPLHGGTRFSNVAHLNDPHIGRGLSTVGAGHFGAGHFTAVAAGHEQISSARMMTGNLPVVPSRTSLSASGRSAAPSTTRGGESQHFFGTHNNVARPQSFQQQTAHLQQSMQQNHVSAIQAGSRVSINNSGAGRGTSAENGGRGEARPASPGANNGNSAMRPTMQGERSAAERSSSSSPSERAGEAANTLRRTEAESPNRGEWKTFTPPSHNEASRGQAGGGASSAERGSAGGNYWNRTAPSSMSAGRSGGESSRPQLNMRQPIVQPRSGGNSGGNGGYRGSPSYGGSRPSYGGGASHSAPSGGGSHPSGGGGGGGHPSGGGGGGGGHSSGGGHH